MRSARSNILFFHPSIFFLHAFLQLFTGGRAFAQAPPARDGALLTFTVAPLRVEVSPLLDGDVLNDPAYAGAPVLRGFWQTTPDEGQPSTEETEVRIVYTRDTLYVGIVCFDRNPQEIIVSENRRDAPLTDMDAVLFVLDTYRDRQNGFIFGTNPAGLEYDAQITNEGELSVLAMRTGSSGGFNLNWDGAWEVRTQIGEYGWSAEFAIPFRTLRYGSGNPQTWGINVQRNIRRRKEVAYWVKIPRQYTLNHVSRAGELHGIEVPVPQNLKVVPYALIRARQTATRSGAVLTADAGFDLKYSVTPGVTLDATYNTDFAQVEVDEQQVNLDRFDLFFPEKRPFFLENAGVFDVGSSGEVELFFSRRIGIGPRGGVVPIVGGARLSGKMEGVRFGLLTMQTERVEGALRANNYTAARVIQEFAGRSGVGVLFVNRQGTGKEAPASDHNRTVALDGRWWLGQFTNVQGFVARTYTPGWSGRQHGFRAGISHNSPAWIFESHFTEIGESFNPEVGFLRRRGYRKAEALVFHRHRPSDVLSLHEIRPHGAYRGFWNFRGYQETGFLHLDSHWEFKNGYEVHTGVNFKHDGVVEPFTIYPGIIVSSATYRNVEAQIVVMTNKAAAVSFEMTSYVGGFFSGRYFSGNPTLRMRSGDRFTAQLTWSLNRVKLSEGRFAANVVRTRLAYAFTPRMFLQGLFQYNTVVNNLSTNIRFGWLQSSNTGLFVVYNESSDVFGSMLTFRDRSITIKYSQLFDLVE